MELSFSQRDTHSERPIVDKLVATAAAEFRVTAVCVLTVYEVGHFVHKKGRRKDGSTHLDRSPTCTEPKELNKSANRSLGERGDNFSRASVRIDAGVATAVNSGRQGQLPLTREAFS